MSKQSDKVFHRNNAHATRNYYNFSTIILLRSNLPKFPISFALPPVWFFFSPTIVLDPDQGASFSSSLDRITRPFSEIQIKKPLGSCRKPGTVRGHPVTGATKYLLDRCLNHRITNITTVKYFRQVHRRIQAAINHQLFWLLERPLETHRGSSNFPVECQVDLLRDSTMISLWPAIERRRLKDFTKR